MPQPEVGVITKGMNRVRQISLRAQTRLRGLSVRAANRGRGPTIPPSRLIRLVAGTEDVSWFLNGGELAARAITQTLERHGIALRAFDAILDFGCGCGRVVRQWADLQGPVIHGTDYNPDMIRWCRANLPFARFHLNGLDRGIPVEAECFDFIYSLSVFTHLSEELQHFWIKELSRVLRPGGFLFVTLHGDIYLPQLTSDQQQAYRAGRLVVQKSDREGSNDCATFHPPEYVRSSFARGFEIVDFTPCGALGNPQQDVYLLRKLGRE